MTKLESAESLAKEIISNISSSEERAYRLQHLTNVVNRLKSLQITDDDTLCAAWLHDVLEEKVLSFDDVFLRFGRDVAVHLSSISKDTSLSKKDREANYVSQIKESPINAKLIVLCDIAATLKDLDNSNLSRSAKSKLVKQKRFYLSVIKKSLMENGQNQEGIKKIIDGINQDLKKYRQNPV